MVQEISMTKTEFQERMKKVAEGIGNDLVNELVRVCPVDTSALKQSIKYKVTPSGIVKIWMNEYALYVEFGTSPHIIEVKNKKVLSNGKSFFGKKVQHPGTRPQPFIRSTIKTKLPNIVKENIMRHLIQ